MELASNRRAPARRAGTAYVMILGVSMILLIIGLSAASVARINTRNVAADADWAEAQQLAFSAADHALARIGQTPAWRTTFRTSAPQCNLGAGSFQWRLVDTEDGVLDNDVEEPFTIQATGAVGEASYELALRCYVMGQPLAALATCLHAEGGITVARGGRVTAIGGKLSTNGDFHTANANSRVTGDVDAASLSGPGRISGTVTVPAPPKPLPHARVFDIVQAMATRLPTQSIYRQVLSPSLNPWGLPNPGGVYYIDAPGAEVTLRDSRIWGALIVRCRTLRVIGNVTVVPFRTDLPALLVQGDLELDFNSGADLRENAENTNFNPPGAPWQGVSDADRTDRYPSELRGLVHVRGDLTMLSTSRVVGMILCEGAATLDDRPELTHDPTIPQAPPIGYTFGAGWIYPESWRRIVR